MPQPSQLYPRSRHFCFNNNNNNLHATLLPGVSSFFAISFAYFRFCFSLALFSFLNGWILFYPFCVPPTAFGGNEVFGIEHAHTSVIYDENAACYAMLSIYFVAILLIQRPWANETHIHADTAQTSSHYGRFLFIGIYACSGRESWLWINAFMIMIMWRLRRE